MQRCNATWAAHIKRIVGLPISLILMGKLLDDGNTLYKKQRLQESTQRFQYALKKFPPSDDYGGAEYQAAFHQLKIHLSLNLARCKRKLGVSRLGVTRHSGRLIARLFEFAGLERGAHYSHRSFGIASGLVRSAVRASQGQKRPRVISTVFVCFLSSA